MKNYLISVCWVILLLFGGCQAKKDSIHIATKPMNEQFILGEMLRLLIEENTDLKVIVTKGIGGGTSIIHPAMLKGKFDLYPEYTGTGWLMVLKKDSLPPAQELYEQLQEEYLQKYGLSWIAPYGFNNAYGLAVNEEQARTYGLHKISDLTRYPEEFTFGAEYDFFEREDGYPALCRCYDLTFKNNRDMDIGLKYEAIKSGKVDVMNIFTTDGQLTHANLRILEDDKHFFPSYYCATVVRTSVLEEHPELKKALEKMDGILTDNEMAELNYQVDIEGQTEQEVARNFLVKKGKLEREMINDR